ncbi:MAG: 2-hydroxyacid dehydrogenase [Burkholderiaceae bacterium]|nr:2-hydroxyacid dehydrogenase [Burkholderiaceae bacterium]
MTASDTTQIDLLMIGPSPVPEMITDLDSRYRLHKWWEVAEADRPAFLAEQGQSIRGVVTSGVFGVRGELIADLPKLEIINSFGVGYDAIDIDTAQRRKVRVTNTPEVLDECVADTALALLLAVTRRVVEADRFVRNGLWLQKRFGVGTKVSGKRVGIAGLGNIGRQIAQRAEAFGMRVAYSNRKPRTDAPAHYDYFASVAELATHCDFLVLAVPGGAATKHLVNAEVLRNLGPEGYLINIARGTVVDELALIEALQTGAIAGAGLDVFEYEPKVPDALTTLSNVVLLPHVGSGTHETRQAMADLTIANIDAWFKEGRTITQVV